MPAKFVKICLLCLILAAGSYGALAQAPEEIGRTLDKYAAELETIDATLDRETVSDEEVRKARNRANEIASAANDIALALQPDIAELGERREALLPDEPAAEEPPSAEAPTEEPTDAEASIAEVQDGGTPKAAPAAEEPEALVREREEVEQAYVLAEGLAKRARAIATRATQLSSHAAAIERDRFTRRIFKHDGSILDPSFWRQAFADIPVAWSRTASVFRTVYDQFVSRGAVALIPVLLFLVSVAIVAVTRFRRFLGDRVSGLVGHGVPTDLNKAIVAILVALLITIIPFGGLILARISATSLDLVSPPFLTFLNTATIAVLAMSICTGFARAVLAPNWPEWRLAVAEQEDAEALVGYVQWSATVVALAILLQGVATIANLPQSTIVFVGAFICLLFAWLYWRALKPFRSILVGHAGSAGQTLRFSRLMRLYGILAAAGVLAIAVAVAIGFVPLAWFLVRQFVWIGVILAIYGLLSNLLDALGGGLLAAGEEPGRIARYSGLNDRTVTQFATVAFGIAKIFLASVALIAIAAPLGLKSDSFFEQTRVLLAGFQVGDLVISPLLIIEAAGIFFLSLIVTRSIKAWVSDQLLPTTTLDPGLKNSISTTVGYIGVIVSIVVAFAFVGIDLSQLGLVAGALSVGIGFGLQSIVANFVSGLILLAERPIKAGDWIVVAGEEGTVKKINVRATELETFDRASVVIPNSDLISGKVQNWVLGGSLGRGSITIGVGYGSDPEQVRDILLDCAKNHELILAYPEPKVFFVDFGDSALIFRLDIFLADISNGFRTRSDLRYDIIRRFREAGIEIPFPQRDLNIRDTDELRSVIGKFEPGGQETG